MAREDDDEEGARGRHAAHVSRSSHARGGGHTVGFVARAARDRKNWDASPLIEEDDEMVHPLYQGMKFADYEYREFPKWVGDKVVDNEDEEQRVLSGMKLLREPDERARLVAIVDVKGIAGVDKRWNVEKLRKAVVDAGFDPEFDPRV